MRLVELRRTMNSYVRPRRFQVAPQPRCAETMVGILQHRRIVANPPHQQVGVSAQARQVVPSSGVDTGLSRPLVGALNKAATLVILGRKRGRDAEYRVHRPFAGGVDLLGNDRGVAGIGRCGVGAGGNFVVAWSLNHRISTRMIRHGGLLSQRVVGGRRSLQFDRLWPRAIDCTR